MIKSGNILCNGFFNGGQVYFDLEIGKKNLGLGSSYDIVGVRDVAEGKFIVDEDFYEKIDGVCSIMKNHVSRGAYCSPEELIGFHAWSEMSEHEKNMAILVLKQLARNPYEPLFEVPHTGGIKFTFDPYPEGGDLHSGSK